MPAGERPESVSPFATPSKCAARPHGSPSIAGDKDIDSRGKYSGIAGHAGVHAQQFRPTQPAAQITGRELPPTVSGLNFLPRKRTCQLGKGRVRQGAARDDKLSGRAWRKGATRNWRTALAKWFSAPEQYSRRRRKASRRWGYELARHGFEFITAQRAPVRRHFGLRRGKVFAGTSRGYREGGLLFDACSACSAAFSRR